MNHLFQTHNAKLISNLIPKGDEPIYARSWIDPNCEDFNRPISELIHQYPDKDWVKIHEL